MTTKAIKERSEMIVERFKEKNVTTDLETLNGELSTLVETYGMDIREAENAIVSRIAREHDITMYTGSFDTSVAEIKALTSGAWATLEVRCVDVVKPLSRRWNTKILPMPPEPCSLPSGNGRAKMLHQFPIVKDAWYGSRNA